MSDRAHDPAALALTLDDMHAGAMALLPSGAVWPRDPRGVLSRTVRGLTGVQLHAWRRVVAMLLEADPRTCYETLAMWETDCGLPDPCLEQPPTSIEGRRASVVAKRQSGAVTTPLQFVELAAVLGYEIEVIEFRPFRVWSNCNDALNTDGWWQPFRATSNCNQFLNSERISWAHTWLVNMLDEEYAIHNMTCTSSCTESLRTWTESELECLFPPIAPAQTHLMFAYRGSLNVGPFSRH